MRALNPFAPFWYTPAEDKDLPEGQRTRFKLRGLNGSEFGHIAPELIVDPELRMVSGVSGKGLDLALRYGLVDWENFCNDNGEVAFSVQNLVLIEHAARAELAMQIIAASYVKPAEKKTSP
jgi:hypothetical protein